MARMRARMAAILGVAIALALPPRMALASSYVKFEYTDLSLSPLARPAEGLTFSLPDSAFQYSLLPYSLPYSDSTSSSYSESGSAHSAVSMTEQTYSLTLSQLDNGELRVSIPGRIWSLGSSNTFHWNVTSSTANGFGGGTYTIPTSIYEPSGYSYVTTHQYRDGYGYVAGPIDDFMSVGEHDIIGSGDTVYDSSGSSTGLIRHEKFLADGLYFSECPFPEASSDGQAYFFLGFGLARSGSSNNYFKRGTRFYAYSARYNYWRDDWKAGSPFSLVVFGWGYRSGSSLYVSTSFDYNSFTLPADADAVGLILRRSGSSGAWSSKVVLRPPSIYMVDPIVENTIIEETEQQTETLMDTTGSGSILSGLTDGGVQGFNQKLGFLGQIGDVANTFNSSLTNATANSVVQFPGIVVQGITLVPAQGVDLWQNGLNAFEQPVKMAFTFAFVAAWVNGMKRLLDYQILGEPYSGEVQE